MPNPFETRKENKSKDTGQRIAPFASGAGNAGIRPQNVTYTITNDVADRTFDANANSTLELADVVATLLRDLAAAGIIKVA